MARIETDYDCGLGSNSLPRFVYTRYECNYKLRSLPNGKV